MNCRNQFGAPSFISLRSLDYRVGGFVTEVLSCTRTRILPSFCWKVHFLGRWHYCTCTRTVVYCNGNVVLHHFGRELPGTLILGYSTYDSINVHVPAIPVNVYVCSQRSILMGLQVAVSESVTVPVSSCMSHGPRTSQLQCYRSRKANRVPVQYSMPRRNGNATKIILSNLYRVIMLPVVVAWDYPPEFILQILYIMLQ